METGGFLPGEFSELLLRKGIEPLLRYHFQELDGEIKGALIESHELSKTCATPRSPRSADV